MGYATILANLIKIWFWDFTSIILRHLATFHYQGTMNTYFTYFILVVLDIAIQRRCLAHSTRKFTIITLWNKISFHPFSPQSLKVIYSSISQFCSLQLCTLTGVWSPHTAAVCLGPTQQHSVKWYSLCSPLASTAPDSHPSSPCLDNSANGLENVFHLFFRGWGKGISHLTFSQEALEKNSSYYCELLFNIYYS